MVSSSDVGSRGRTKEKSDVDRSLKKRRWSTPGWCMLTSVPGKGDCLELGSERGHSRRAAARKIGAGRGGERRRGERGEGRGERGGVEEEAAA
jgi:hypothetical protein